MVRTKQKRPKITLVTSQISGQPIHQDLLENMEAFAKHLDASIVVMKNYQENANALIPEDSRKVLWEGDERTSKYLCPESMVDLGGTVLMGHVNIRPKSMNPLNTTTKNLMPKSRKGHCVFGHPQIAVESQPRLMSESRRSAYTTGTLTVPDAPCFRRSQSEQAASFHASLGFLVVVEGGHVFPVYANRDGSFKFLNWQVGDEDAAFEDYAAASLGDIHLPYQDEHMVQQVLYLLDTLEIDTIALHDALDFHTDSHHEQHTRDRLLSHQKFGSVTQELQVYEKEFRRLFSGFKVKIIGSNHNDYLDKWLDTSDVRKINPSDLKMWFKLNLTRLNNPDKHTLELLHLWFEDALSMDVEFFDDRFNVFEAGGIPVIHGHHGISGGRGSKVGLANSLHKIVWGHTHTESIHKGAINSGTLSKLDVGYLNGLTTWTQGLTLIGQGGKRSLLTAQDRVLIPQTLYDRA